MRNLCQVRFRDTITTRENGLIRMQVIEPGPKWGGAQIPYNDGIETSRLTLLDLSLHANAYEFYALEPSNRALYGLLHGEIRLFDPHEEADDTNRFTATE
mgnify:CR=1 FL=1